MEENIASAIRCFLVLCGYDRNKLITFKNYFYKNYDKKYRCTFMKIYYQHIKDLKLNIISYICLMDSFKLCELYVKDYPEFGMYNKIFETIKRLQTKKLSINMNVKNNKIAHLIYKESWFLDYMLQHKDTNKFLRYLNAEQIFQYLILTEGTGNYREMMFYININHNLPKDFASEISKLYTYICNPEFYKKDLMASQKLFIAICKYGTTDMIKKHFQKEYLNLPDIYFYGINFLLPVDIISVWSPDQHMKFSNKFLETVCLAYWIFRYKFLPKFIRFEIIRWLDYSFTA